MAQTDFQVVRIEDLLARILLEEDEFGGIVTSVVKGVDDSGVVFNRMYHRGRAPGDLTSTLGFLELRGGDEDAQREEITAKLVEGNAPVCYTVLAVLDDAEKTVDLDILIFRPDGGAWVSALIPVPHGLGHVGRSIPWSSGKRSRLSFKGLVMGTLASFANPTGGPDVVAAVTDADIDTDGPGGSQATDPFWSPNTSLRYPSGASCDSREFRGVVTPPALRQKFGIAIGDLAWVSLGDREFGAQVYDSGPEDKIGEISFRLAVDLGIYPNDSKEVERSAARNGNDVKNLVTVFFPGSGNGKAMAAEAIEAAAQACVRQWLGTMLTEEEVLFTDRAGSWAEFFASLNLSAFFSVDDPLVKTNLSPNTPPPQKLWQNIAPTLAVLAEIQSHFGKKVHFHSTYRSPSYNAGVGGAQRSQHLAFRAADFHVEDVSPVNVAEFARSLRGKPFTVGLPGLTLSNEIAGASPPPALNLTKLNFRPSAAGGTEFTFHGGVRSYPTFVHVDCRGEDAEW